MSAPTTPALRIDPSGSAILRLAAKHIGEQYVFGARVPKDNPKWRGPWDCAEFTSWLVFQVTGKLFGCHNNAGNPSLADAYTGYWDRDAKAMNCAVDYDRAARTAGAFVLRYAQPGAPGHIVVSDGRGGTVEAHSSKRGVIRARLNKRRWDLGILPPGIAYTQGPPLPPVAAPVSTVLTLRKPSMSGPLVRRVQRALKKNGLDPGPVDGAYGPMTAAAVRAFQLQRRLVVDGEAGPVVAKALGIKWD